ncbi:MAG: hypothetical protein ABJ308_05540 [Halieaceae bacterium]
MSELSSRTDKLITCILPKGVAQQMLEKLKQERGITRVNINSARGSGKITPLAYRGLGGQTEKEILNVAVAGEQADELFAYIYVEAEINRPHGGLMYLSQLSFATPFILPDLPEED